MTAPLRTALIGFGMMGAGFAEDPVMARHFPYASHAQVLRDHPLFSWEAVVDPSEKALENAGRRWNVPLLCRSVEELAGRCRPEVAVIAIPPRERMEILEGLSDVRAVFVEKPLGETLDDATHFVRYCMKRGILLQVNFWRRGDELFRELAAGGLGEKIGQTRSCFGLYGNGLRNNGSHLIDFARMLLGECADAQVLSPQSAFSEGPIAGDRNVPFLLLFGNGQNAVFQPLPFARYREVGLDLWGEKGRLSILQEGLGVFLYPRKENRALTGEWEIASDCPEVIAATCGTALYRMYDNLSEALFHGAALWSPGESALENERIVQNLMDQIGVLPAEGERR
ncbi:MAG: Gfo/Idh/MocA family oxidoreductase [Thermodesulfobacteriota bacterium]